MRRQFVVQLCSPFASHGLTSRFQRESFNKKNCSAPETMELEAAGFRVLATKEARGSTKVLKKRLT